jgi:hypothetical protein
MKFVRAVNLIRLVVWKEWNVNAFLNNCMLYIKGSNAHGMLKALLTGAI